MSETKPLGDKIAELTAALGLKHYPGCGCGRRQKALNEIPPDQGVIDTVKSVVKAIVAPPPEEEEKK